MKETSHPYITTELIDNTNHYNKINKKWAIVTMIEGVIEEEEGMATEAMVEEDTEGK